MICKYLLAEVDPLDRQVLIIFTIKKQLPLGNQS